MELQVRGKTALITGASGGLGAHFAGVLARAGARVTLGARRADKLADVVAGLTAAGHEAEAVDLDVTDEKGIAALFARQRFDIVINNAGISGAGMAIDMPAEEWDRVIDTNLRGSFLVAQAAARAMRKAESGGSIVNIASILGLRVGGAVIAYTTSKAAVVQMTKALALEWARFGIRVNALCPGYVETPINADFFASKPGQALISRIPQRRLGQEAELDAPLLLLASDAGSYITGATLAVDGGHLVSTL
ncbi:SDR family oxidoreductase [Paracoccus sp. Z118]|uniref:SDR family NAD(P)-dependent oxidoreductase n=1 Tax=Paracoccus sp. Z118 TaxID=2851017 RepID=UPI001C2B8274|nr:SDR family oxidoreductase [Paracoccus sp. Z118]MBV0891539.1 SDR family oxidoreductase [Paracoccus sp. Z118]